MSSFSSAGSRFRIVINCGLWLAALVALVSCGLSPEGERPGKTADGKILLPNGWMLSPAGRAIDVGDLPLGLALSADKTMAAVVNGGYSKNTVSIVYVAGRRLAKTIDVGSAWNGVVFSPDGRLVYVSSNHDNSIRAYEVSGDSTTAVFEIALGPPFPEAEITPAGISLSGDGKTLWVATRGDNSLYCLDLPGRRIAARVAFEKPLYTCLTDEERGMVYASVWGQGMVAEVDMRRFSVTRTAAVGDHPCDLAKSGGRLFVANANHNTVSVVDLETFKAEETLSVALGNEIRPGSTPNALAVGDSGKILLVANADNNCLAVVDIAEKGESRVAGFIPTGWYPTAVAAVGDAILVAEGKGMGSKANSDGSSIRGLFNGTLSFIDMPNLEKLAGYTNQVLENCPLTRRKKETARPYDSPIPEKPGFPTPIKHVFYIIKENRTYDQVLGDLPQGNGDPELCIFGRDVTPNHHALAEEFVLLDNFYVDAEVSADGHNWSMSAYANDYAEKTWPAFLAGRGGRWDYEEEGMASSSGGYIWDLCLRHGVTFRNYGEFVSHKRGFQVMAEGLRGRTAPDFRGWDLKYPDVKRAKAWMKEFTRYKDKGKLPHFQIIRLPNDHTAGTKAGDLTPRAMVADNDLALGMVVETISNSRFWPQSAIFVLEDDAQYGSDHVDAHRSPAFVISPYARRGAVDHSMYTTSSMLRTMELILGLPPMTQFDAGAAPMYSSFTAKPDPTPYVCRPSAVDLWERNAKGAWGQDWMAGVNLDREDAVPEIQFNEVVWKSVKGSDSPMPSPVRSAVFLIGDRVASLHDAEAGSGE